MVLRLRHRTFYKYASPARESHNEVRLKPLDDATQTCLSFVLRIDPAAKMFEYKEPGGTVHHFSLRAPHRTLDIIAESEVETVSRDPFATLNLITDDWAHLAPGFAEFLAASPYVDLLPEAEALAAEVRAKTGPSVANFAISLSKEIRHTYAYDPDATHVHSRLNEVIALKAGVCQDFAHLMIACCRSQGIATRYVSGYLFVGDEIGMRGEQETHAWVECLMPSGEWLGLDPTNSVVVDERYVKVHTGRDYSEVAPVKGIYIGSPTEVLDVSVAITRSKSHVSG